MSSSLTVPNRPELGNECFIQCTHVDGTSVLLSNGFLQQTTKYEHMSHSSYLGFFIIIIITFRTPTGHLTKFLG